MKLLSRTTDPQTVTVKDSMNRDDKIDITDFDVVAYIRHVMRMALEEELATAILIGDNRSDGDPYKIETDKIRPIWGRRSPVYHLCRHRFRCDEDPASGHRHQQVFR